VGIEHPQMDAIAALFKGSVDDKAMKANLMDPKGKTPNQRALACAIALSWARQSQGRPPAMTLQTAAAQTRDLFRAMDNCGHQAVSMTFGCEEGAPDPHSELWMGAMATILREARLQGPADILDAAIGYFADHVAMIRAFWTPAGVRMPCARAKVKPGQELRPNWSVDSRAYASILGLPTAGLAKAASQSLPILQDSASLFPQIAERSKTTALKLAVPIRQWKDQEGGFVAAFVQAVPLNDPCAVLSVDPSGTILDAAKTLDGFTPPAGDPVVFGGSLPVPDPGPSDPPDPHDPPASLQALAAAVRGLLLPQKQAALKEAAAEAIENGKLADALPLVQQFGIGENQPQAVAWKQIIAALAGGAVPA
jgi:hypothetical protein